jgi:AraC family transcriptional regulator of arabinose operon
MDEIGEFMSILDLMKREPDFISTQVAEARRYYGELNPRSSADVVVVCGGRERMRPDYVVDRADFPYFGIECVAEGSGSLELAGHGYELAAGMAFAYGPGIHHRIRSRPERPMLKYYVDFAGREAELLLRESALGKWKVVQLPALQEITGIFDMLQREGGTAGRYTAPISAALLRVLIWKIDQQALGYGSVDLRSLETFQRAKRVIEEGYLTLRSAEEAARACHLDPSYLSRLFRRFAATTPHRYITKLKMNRATELLLDQRMLVKEAALHLGFADPFHFSRTFKRVYGISPEQFVRQTRPLTRIP